MSEGMKKVEVIVDRVPHDARNERFIEWLDGWLRARYKVLGAYVRHNGAEVAFVVEKDAFRLFGEMYRVVERMRDVLGVGARVAVCSGDECIDLTEDRMETFMLLVSKYKVKELKKVKNMIRRVLSDVNLFDMCANVVSNGGRIWIDVGCGRAMLYVDEAIVISEMLLDRMYANVKLRILREAADVLFKMFERNVDLSMIDIVETDGEFEMMIGGCRLRLNYDEALRLVYELLEWSVIGLRRSLIEAEGHGI